MLLSFFDDAHLGAASVGNQRSGWSLAGNFRKKIEGHSDGQRDIDEIGFRERWPEIAGKGFIKRSAHCFSPYHFRAIPAGQMNVGEIFPQRQREGAADEAGAQNRDAADEVFRHEARSLPSTVLS